MRDIFLIKYPYRQLFLLTMTQYWIDDEPLSAAEQKICKRLKHTGKLFVFLRKHRHRIFSDGFCEELESMYHDHPRGKSKIPPSILGMATLLQAYEQTSDAGAVLEAAFDKRWQMVLGCLDEEEPPFSQGTLCDFRHRMIRYNMDEKLLQQSIRVAKEYGDFCFKRLRIALDSAPLQGAGKVEDTFNLIGHALELVVDCAAMCKKVSQESVRHEAGTQFIGKSSVKAALDVDWSVPQEKHQALALLMDDVERVEQWLTRQSESLLESAVLQESLALLTTVLSQNTDPDPDGTIQVKREVVRDRLICISDPQMRHGRKSASRTINGYKQHIAVELNSHLIIGGSVRPANEPEYQATDELRPQIEVWGEVDELQFDRGYLASSWVGEMYASDKRVVSKPWSQSNVGKFSKKDFDINLKEQKVTCPAGFTARIKGRKQKQAKFDAAWCGSCHLRSQCTDARERKILTLHAQEEMMIDLRQYTDTPAGRKTARERVKVEHALAGICNRKGPVARYRGVRSNTYDLNRVAAISNLHVAMSHAA